MIVTVRITTGFKRAVKPLLKKYLSLSKDLLKLESDLIANPKLGVPIGNNVYKIRLKISSNAKGKRAGARVISFLETTLIGEIHTSEKEVTVNLLTIYHKGETATITDKELKKLINAFYKST